MSKIVKTFKESIPQPTALMESEIVKVHFEPTTGLFTIDLPEHIRGVVQALEIYKRNSDPNRVVWIDTRGKVVGRQMDNTIAVFTSTLKEYLESLKLQMGEKVILVRFAKNLYWKKDRPAKFNGHGKSASEGFGDQISFGMTPAISLNYDILWRVNTGLYDKLEHAAYKDTPAYSTMIYKASVPKDDRGLIPWTQERQDFLKGIVGKIEDLGWLLVDFFEQFEKNITFAIGTGQLALAPPDDHA